MANLNRFKWWVLMIVSSTIVTLSVAYRTYKTGWWLQDDKFIIFTSISSFALAVTGLVCSISTRRTAIILEAICICIEVILWSVAVVMAILSNHFNSTSSGDFGIGDPNSFFWGTAALVGSIFLMSNWFRISWLRNEEAINVTSWMFMSTAGFIVLVSGIAYRTEDYVPSATQSPISGDKDDPTTTTDTCVIDDRFSCARLNFAIVLGAISASISAVLVPLRTGPMKCQQEIAFLLFISWCCGVGYLTYSTGPATQANAMYFATWISCLVSMNIVLSCALDDMVEEPIPDNEAIDNVNEEDGETNETENRRQVNTSADHSDDLDSFDPRAEFEPLERGEIFQIAANRMSPALRTRESMMRKETSHAYFLEVETWYSTKQVGASHQEEVMSLSSVQQDDASLHFNIAINTKIDKEKHVMNRLQTWFALLIVSICCLGAYAPYLSDLLERTRGAKTNNDEEDEFKPDGREDWIIISTSMSIIVSIFGFLTSARSRRWTYLLEGFFILLSISLWIVCLNAIGLVFGDVLVLGFEGEDAVVDNANQFFTSWAGLFTSIILLTRWFSVSLTTKDWLLCTTTSLALFGSVRALESNPDQLETFPIVDFTPEELRMAGSIGLASTLISGLMLVLSLLPLGRHLLWTHLFVSTSLFFVWCWGVSFICFGPKTLSPHTGTVWFASWFSLILTMNLALQNFAFLVRLRQKRKEREHREEEDEAQRLEESDGGEENNTSMPVETWTNS